MIIIGICLVPSVYSLGVGPLSIDVTVERGKETEITRDVAVTNPATNPIHISGTVAGSISQFVTISPKEFDLEAGPGIMSGGARPYKYVMVNIKIPREVSENRYTGEIIFTERPTTGGVLGTAAQLGVRVSLSIGTLANAVFPMYINILIGLLVVLLVVSLIYKRKEIKQ
jgi:hypothetical protein